MPIYILAIWQVYVYSLAGGLLSLAIIALLKKYADLSIIRVSVAGGVFHNIGQLVVAAIVVETYSVTGYLPVLLVAADRIDRLCNRNGVCNWK